MNIKSPFADVSLDFDTALCSKTVADEEGVLKTGYCATCPETKKPFEVQVTITGVGSDKEQAQIATAALPPAAILAQARNKIADKARKAAKPEAEKTAERIVATMLSVNGPALPAPVAIRLMGTVAAALVAKAVEAPLAAHDAMVKKMQAKKAVADKALAKDAIARAGG